jgi:integrase
MKSLRAGRGPAKDDPIPHLSNTLKDLLGHATLAMVMRYAHHAPEHLRSAVSRLDDVLAPSRSGEIRAEQTETLLASKS